MRSVVASRRSLWAADEADQWSPTSPNSALFDKSEFLLEDFFASLFSLLKSALYSLSFESKGPFLSGGRLRASKSIRLMRASASDKSLFMSDTFCDFESPERLPSILVFLASCVESSQYSRSYPSKMALISLSLRSLLSSLCSTSVPSRRVASSLSLPH